MKPAHYNKGFTLVEVLVALVILATALTAVIKTSSENTINAAHLRNKYLASLVAANKVSELQVSQTWPSTGNSNGNIELAHQRWLWNMKIENTADKHLRRIVLAVSLEQEKEHVLYKLTSYLGKPK